MTFHERKRERTAYYERFIKGFKLVTCSACNGSGRYDARNSPPCGSCDGSGKVRVKPQAGSNVA